MIHYKVATSFKEVTEAWCTVYKQYLGASLILPNQLSIFTFPEYISNNTAVIMGKKMGHTVCTVSALLDSERGLPLDHYYGRDLRNMRNEGKKLIEIGLLADSRGTGNFNNITGLMSGIARYGVFSDHHDFVIGVHPRRIPFFNQVFGFKQAGEIKDYGKLKTAPVVLMHANGKELQSYALNKEIYEDPCDFDFANRFQFNPGNFMGQTEFSESVANFIHHIWTPKPLQAA